jgi:phosphoglycolate phosphatase
MSQHWPRGVIFDLDGTLVDSAPDIAAALNVALRQAGLTALPLDLVTSFVGGGARLLIERGLVACGEAASEERIDAVYAEFLTAYEREPARLTTVYPGAIEVLERLKAADVKLGICTNKPVGLTKAVLERLSLAAYFGSIVAADGRLPLKPAPDMLRRGLQELDVAAGHAVMVGDSAADAGVAKAAGVRSIIVEHGYSQIPVISLGADVVIASFDAFLPSLSQLGSIASA